MKITADVRKYADENGFTEEAAKEKGTEELAKEFAQSEG